MTYSTILIIILVLAIVIVSTIIVILSLMIYSKGRNKSTYDQVKEDEEQIEYLKK